MWRVPAAANSLYMAACSWQSIARPACRSLQRNTECMLHWPEPSSPKCSLNLRHSWQAIKVVCEGCVPVAGSVERHPRASHAGVRML